MRAAVDDVQQRHGQDVRVRPADPAVERHLRLRGGSLRDRERDAEDGVRAEARLRRASRRARSSPRRSRAARARPARGCDRRSRRSRGRPRGRRPSRPRPRRRRAARPPRARRSRRPEGTAAAPNAPESSPISTSTVGLPRESSTWRPWTWTIELTALSLARVARRTRVARPAAPWRASYHASCASRSSSAHVSPGRRRQAARRARRASTKRPLVARRASSGSTFATRATLTTVKSRSPISSNTRGSASVSGAGRPARASSASISSSSSRIFASGPSRPGQSNPTAAARRCTLRAWRSPGSDVGHVVEDAGAALLLGLDRLPARAHPPRPSPPRRRRRRAGAGGRASRARPARPPRGRPHPAPRGAGRGSTSGREGRRARPAASPASPAFAASATS